MNDQSFNYKNEDDSFSISYRKALSHNMPYNHFHSGYELFYLISGERCFFIKDRTIIIKEGDLVLIQPNILHKTTNSDLPEHERIIVNFDRAFLSAPNAALVNSIYPSLQNEYIIINLSVNNRIYVEDSLNKILEEVQQKGIGYELYCETLILQLLIFCSRFLEQNSVKPLMHPSPVHEKISEVVQFINEQYSRDLSLHYLADKFYISHYYLSRVFKDVTGFNFIEYLNSVRVKEAKKLLEDSQLKVNKIAEKVGFGSITHFGRVFREITGHAPLYYRKNNKASERK